MQRPEIHRGRSYRELVKDRELLSICGSREELSDYILDQIRRFTFIENKLDFVSDAANRNYVLSHTRSPSLQRKQASRSSVDVTLSHLSNLYLKISADSHILDLYKQLKDTVEPLCDQQQIFTLEMILLKFSKDVEVESGLVDKVVTIHSFEEVRKLLETSIFKRLRPDAEKIISPLLPEWFQSETKHTYCREDSSNIRRTVRLFLRHLLKDLPQHTTVEGFLSEFPRFPDRLKEFLNKLQKMMEEYGLETARKRGHKLTILIVQSHFIPQLAIFSQKEAADSLCEHRYNNTKAFKKALSIFRRRGFNAHLIVADEFAFIREEVITDLIMPLMMQDQTAIVGLTTPKGEKKQFFAMLLKALDRNGKPIFMTVRCKEYCESCALAGHADTCPHEVYARSTNKTAKSMDAVNRAYGEDYQLQRQQEVLGMDGDSTGSIIPTANIEKFLRNVVNFVKRFRCGYLSIDPGGGGKNSEMAVIIAGELLDNSGVRLVLLNVTGYPLHLESGAETETTVSYRAIEWISKHPMLRGVPIVVIIEAAPATASSYIIEHLDEAAQKRGVSLIYMEEAKNQNGKRIPGITKTEPLQKAYRYNLQIMLRDRYLAYAKNVETLRADRTGLGEIDRLAKMMGLYHYDDKLKCITTKGLGQKDDILAALVQLCYFGQVFWSDSYYFKQREVLIENSGFDHPFPGSGNNFIENLPTGGKRKISQR